MASSETVRLIPAKLLPSDTRLQAGRLLRRLSAWKCFLRENEAHEEEINYNLLMIRFEKREEQKKDSSGCFQLCRAV